MNKAILPMHIIGINISIFLQKIVTSLFWTQMCTLNSRSMIIHHLFFFSLNNSNILNLHSGFFKKTVTWNQTPIVLYQSKQYLPLNFPEVGAQVKANKNRLFFSPLESALGESTNFSVIETSHSKNRTKWQ